MSIEQNKQIMRRMIEEVWNQGNLATADELFAPDHISPSAPQLPPGSEGVKFLVKAFREAMPDYHMNIDLLMADENQVVGRFTQSGTHNAFRFSCAPLSVPPVLPECTTTEVSARQ